MAMGKSLTGWHSGRRWLMFLLTPFQCPELALCFMAELAAWRHHNQFQAGACSPPPGHGHQVDQNPSAATIAALDMVWVLQRNEV